jgi:hypothetical protein
MEVLLVDLAEQTDDQVDDVGLGGLRGHTQMVWGSWRGPEKLNAPVGTEAFKGRRGCPRRDGYSRCEVIVSDHQAI